MQEGNLSFADGMMMRSLVNFPGGLELHIGVRAASLTNMHPAMLQQRCRGWSVTQRQGDVTLGSVLLQMWIPALMGQASEEQQQRWLPPSQRLEVSLPSGWHHKQRLGGAPAVQHVHQLAPGPQTY